MPLVGEPLACIEPRPGEDRAVMLAAVVAMGDEQGVRRILESDPGAVNELGLDGTSPLCAASLWGHTGILRLLLQALAAPCLQNHNGAHWTALHAAALQEEGKSCMILLDAKADPQAADREGVTPCDYASCSEAVWPLFAARSCERIPKATLVAKGVIRKVSESLEQMLVAEGVQGDASRRGILSEFSRPGSSYVVTREHPPRPGSTRGHSSSRPVSSRKPAQSIDILEEEVESDMSKANNGLRSLNL